MHDRLHKPQTTFDAQPSSRRATTSLHPLLALQQISGNQLVQKTLSRRISGADGDFGNPMAQADPLWIEVKPTEIVDAAPRELNDYIFVDQTYIYRVPSPSYKTENVDQWSIEVLPLSQKAGASIDGIEIRINVGFRQRNFGRLPKVWYEKVPKPPPRTDQG